MSITLFGSRKKDDNGYPTGWVYKNVAAAATTVVKGAPGMLHSISINTPIASDVITIYDNASAGSGTKIGTITFPGTLVFQGPIPAVFDVVFLNGLTIVSAGNSDFTVSYI